MPNKIGLSVIERDTNTSPAIVPSEVNNVGILFKSERGPINRSIELTSISQDRLIFGKPRTPEFGAYVKRGLFINARGFGARIYGVRIAGTIASPAVAASATAISGDTRLDARAVGVAGNNYRVTVAAGTIAGTRKLTIQDDPTTPSVVEIFDNITTDNFADAINRGVLLAGTSGGTGHVDGSPSILVQAAFTGILPAIAGIVAFTGGSANVLSSYTFTPTATDCIFRAGMNGLDDPGAWANNLYITVEATPGSETKRNITVYRLINGQFVAVESLNELTSTDFVSKINDPSRGSKFIKVATVGEVPNGNINLLNLASGSDGGTPTVTEFTGDSASKTGIYALDEADIQILASADLIDPVFTKSLETYAASRGNITVVATATYGASTATLQTTWSNPLLRTKSHVAMYRSWGRVADELGGQIWVPLVGHIIGAGYIRRMFNNSEYPHIAPAGLDTPLDDIIEIEYPRYNDNDLTDLVKVKGFNPVMFLSGRGFIIRTSRTMSTESKNYSVHIRRIRNFLKQTLSDNLNWLEQSGNTEDTRARVRQVLRVFFNDMYNASVFEKAGGYENNVQVKCDEQNNPPSVTQQRLMKIDIKLRFAEIAESIEVNLESTQQGILVSDV